MLLIQAEQRERGYKYCTLKSKFRRSSNSNAYHKKKDINAFLTRKSTSKSESPCGFPTKILLGGDGGCADHPETEILTSLTPFST